MGSVSWQRSHGRSRAAVPIPPAPPAPPAPERGAPGAAGARRRGVRRREAAPAQRWGVICIAVLGGIVAVAWSDAAPTGSPVFDAVERFVLAAAVAAAGSRSRRWTLALSTTLVAIGTAGVERVLAAGALLGTIALVETRTRNRLAGAVIGATAGVLAQGLQLPGPVWVEVVVGSLAVVPVLVSGYRRTRPDSRSRIRRAGLFAAAGLGAFAAVGAVAALVSAPAVLRAAEHSRSAVASLQDGDGAAASTAMQAASEEFDTANRLVGSWWASGAQLLPFAGANVSAARDVVSVGAELTGGASVLLEDLDFERLRGPEGGVDLAQLELVAPPLRRAAAQVDDASAELGEISSTWLVPPVADQLDRVRRELRRLRLDARRVDLALEHLPELLGGSEPRRYLVLLGNPAESRDLGGHIGNWVELEAVAGDIRLAEVGGPLELTLPVEARTPELVEAMPPSLRAMNPLQYPQNLSGTPDLPTAARAASELVQARTGRRIDGVVYADVEAFAALLSLAGAVEVPGARPPVQLRPDNAVEFLTVGQYQSFPDDDAAGDALEVVIREVFDRLTSTRLGSPEQLAELFAPLVAEGRFQFASLHRGDAPLLDDLGLQGALPDASQHTEVVGVLHRNVGPSKIDSFLTREVDADFVWDAGTATVDGVVHVELHNAAPAEGLSRTVIGNAAGVPVGTNLTDLVLVTPHPLDAALVDGIERAAHPVKEGALWRHTVRVAIPPGGTVVVDLHLAPLRRPGGGFSVSWIGHPGVGRSAATIRVNHDRGDPAPDPFDAAIDVVWRLSDGRWTREKNPEAGS